MHVTKLDIQSANEDGVRMEIFHPVTEQSFDPPIYVWVVGVDSDLYQKHSLALQNLTMKKMMQRGRFRPNIMSAEESQKLNIELLAKCTLKWENVEWEGKPLPCNLDNVKMVYSKLTWFREQVGQFVEDRANFLSD